MKKALFIGGNGAIGTYLIKEARAAGWAVDVVCMEETASNDPFLRYIKHDARDFAYMKALVNDRYDVIVDFMVYQPNPDDFHPFADLYMEKANHYLWLSTYRVYGPSSPITEKSPRLYDITLPDDFVRYGE
ncbi:MAG: hypothetical protein KBT31_00870 [Firmicutes bacterium]|nr:hypothetical protein [Candidatus Colimorpha enterica]